MNRPVMFRSHANTHEAHAYIHLSILRRLALLFHFLNSAKFIIQNYIIWSSAATLVNTKSKYCYYHWTIPSCGNKCHVTKNFLSASKSTYHFQQIEWLMVIIIPKLTSVVRKVSSWFYMYCFSNRCLMIVDSQSTFFNTSRLQTGHKTEKES